MIKAVINIFQNLKMFTKFYSFGLELLILLDLIFTYSLADSCQFSAVTGTVEFKSCDAQVTQHSHQIHVAVTNDKMSQLIVNVTNFREK